jgi:hypothetical protein
MSIRTTLNPNYLEEEPLVKNIIASIFYIVALFVITNISVKKPKKIKEDDGQEKDR